MRWIVLLVAGCASQGRIPGPYFAETADVATRGQIVAAVLGGLGLDPLAGAGYGGAARVGVGLGGGHEVRLEGTASERELSPHDICLDCGDAPPESQGSATTTAARSLALSWKYAYRPTTAAIVTVGFTAHHLAEGAPADDPYGRSFAPAIAIISSRPVNPSMDFYAGDRLQLAFPIGSHNPPDAAKVIANSVALGMSGRPARGVRLYTELGLFVNLLAPGGADEHCCAPEVGLDVVLGLETRL